MAARIAVMTSRLVGSLCFAPAIRSSADCGSSIDWLMTCAQPSLMTRLSWLEWLGWGGLCCLVLYSSGEEKMLEPFGSGRGRRGCRAAVAAVAETVVDEGWEGRGSLPTLEAVREIGVGVGLLAWLQSKGFVRVQERVWGCIRGGGGRALGVVWGSASISESESPSSPQGTVLTLESAAHCPIWAERTGVGDHVSGFELLGSEGPPEVGVLPDIFWREMGTLGVVTKYFWRGAMDIST